MTAGFVLGPKKAEDYMNNWERFQFCSDMIIASAGGVKGPCDCRYDGIS
jgi:hypothetical protein